MDVLKIAGFCGVTLAVILTACSRTPSSSLPPDLLVRDGAPAIQQHTPPPPSLVHDPRILETRNAIVLVHVVEINTGDVPNSSMPCRSGCATVRVLKSWKGPYPVGRVLQVVPSFTCNGRIENCGWFVFQAGENEVVMFIQTQEPIQVGWNSAWPAEKSQALMAALDQAVAQEAADSMPTDKEGYLARLQKEQAALKDMWTKMQAIRDRRAALEKQLPGSAGPLDADIGFDNLNYLASWHREREARWQQKLRTLGWTPPPPPSCDPAAPCARASAP